MQHQKEETEQTTSLDPVESSGKTGCHVSPNLIKEKILQVVLLFFSSSFEAPTEKMYPVFQKVPKVSERVLPYYTE